MSSDRDEQIDEEFLVANSPDAESAPGAEAGANEPVNAEVSGDEAAEATVEQDLNALVEEARSQRDEYLDLAQRTKADFDNYRKRMAAETAAAHARGRLDVTSGLIEAIDNLERVLAAEGVGLGEALQNEVPSDSPISLQGVLVAYRDLNATLKRNGIEVFDPIGEVFDPAFHEALSAIPAETAEPGSVVEVMQRGYRSGETVIRPARVVVSQ